MQSASENLTLDQRIGQLVVVGFPATQPTPDLLDLIARDHVGGVILFSRNLGSPRQVFDLTRQLQHAAHAAGHAAPLLVMTDQENGLVRRLGDGFTALPGNMALGAIGDEQTVYDVAQATAQEMLAVGVNMNLAPVADVNNNPANPVIGVRSFGEDSAQVARLSAAAVRGYQDAGLTATLKHFPGHGDTAVDSHRGLPVLRRTLEELRAVELVPFLAGIRASADCVMVGHLALPDVTGDPRPATLSPLLVQGLLRRDLAFQGVVVSDCLEMDAIAKTVGTQEGAVLALQAGNDLVLISHHHDVQRQALARIRVAVRDGTLSEEQVRVAADRVLSLKRRRLSWETALRSSMPDGIGGPRHGALRDRAYARAITLVRDDAALLPLRLAVHDRILVVAQPPREVTKAVDVPYDHLRFAQMIRDRHPNTDELALAPGDDAATSAAIQAALDVADVVVAVTINAHLDPRQADLLHIVSRSSRPVIGIAACDPYDALTFTDLPTAVATYEYTDAALEAAAAVLFGEAPAQGRLPVSLP
jgi:beta-N-acetylhexosaminidase